MVSYAKQYAQALSEKASVKLHYNKLLLKTRELEAFLDNETLPVEEREARVDEYKALVASLGGLLEEIVDYTDQDIETGFKVNAVNSVNTDYMVTETHEDHSPHKPKRRGR